VGKKEQGLEGGGPKYTSIPRVLVFLLNGLDVLLIKGAPNKRIWANQYNGVGGHVENGEDILSAAKREVLEETGLLPTAFDLKAIVNIDAGDPLLGILMFVFTGWSSQRKTRPSDEGDLHWVPTYELDRYDLVEDLHWLLPRILESKQDAAPMYLSYQYDDDDKLFIDETR
jgi:8-oxo-dGTP diphosphatase